MVPSEKIERQRNNTLADIVEPLEKTKVFWFFCSEKNLLSSLIDYRPA